MILKEQMTSPSGRESKSSRWGFLVLIPLALFIVLLFIFAVKWKDSLIIQKVQVEGARILAAKDVVNFTDIKPQTAMYGVDLFEAEQRLLEQPMIKSVTITRLLVDALRVVIQEREPVASLGGNALRYIDADGVLLPHQQTEVQFDLPLITGVGGLDTAVYGKKINNPEITSALEVIHASEETGFNRSISEVNMNKGGDIVIYSAETGIPIILGRGDMLKKMVMVQTFWNNFMKSDSLGSVKYVDARFEGQVVLKHNEKVILPPPSKKNM
ncbi:MAG: cell division protein FtsQ/DivIB [Bacteroidota bacterium]